MIPTASTLCGGVPQKLSKQTAHPNRSLFAVFSFSFLFSFFVFLTVFVGGFACFPFSSPSSFSLHFIVMMHFLFSLLFFTCLVSGSRQQAVRWPSEYCHGNASFVSLQRPGFSLLKVQLMTRHGDRTPINTMPRTELEVEWDCDLDFVASDTLINPMQMSGRAVRKAYMKNRESLPGNCALGQLTSIGAAQHQMLGKNFRRLYIEELGFLPSQINTTIMFLRSTDVPRTILSAYNFLEGVYPSDENPVPGNMLHLHVVEDPMDNSGGSNTLLCPKLAELFKKQQSSPDYVSYYNRTVAPLAKKYTQVWNLTSPISSSYMHKLNDIMRSRYCHGLPLPMDQADAEALMTAESYLSNLEVSSPQILSLSQYSFLREWVDRFNDTTDVTRFALYSAHDTSIREFLMALHAATLDLHWPPLAGHVALELWSDAAGNKYVAMQYDGQPRMMNTPCADVFCPWNDFVNLVESYKSSPSDCVVNH